MKQKQQQNPTVSHTTTFQVPKSHMGLVTVVMSSTSWKPMSGGKAKYKIQETITTYKLRKLTYYPERK